MPERSATEAPTVVALGEAMLRLAPPLGERLERARLLEVHVAGAEANVAVGLAQLGVPTRWLSHLPDNPLGRRVASDLAAAGVDVSQLTWSPDGRLGIFYAEPGVAPRPTRVWYDRRDSAFTEQDAGDLDAGAVAGAEWAVLSGITLAVGAGPRALAARFVELAADAGAAICFDVNYRALLWSPDDAREALLPMVRAAGLLVCARRDAELVFGLEGSDEDVLVALAELAQGGTTVLTLGREGCIARDPSGAVHSHPGFRATVVDRFGVGDAFVAGLLWGMLAGDLPLALARGAALAALKCGLHGDQAHVRREDAEALLSAGTREVIR